MESHSRPQPTDVPRHMLALSVPAGERISSTSSLKTRQVSTLVRIFRRLFRSRVVPLTDVVSVKVPDPRLPFECEPGRASAHVVNVPDFLIAEPSVVTVCFCVADNGVGITPENQARLCQPFAQV